MNVAVQHSTPRESAGHSGGQDQPRAGKVFRYKLDFYYQQTLLYLVTLLVYVGVFGSVVENQFLVVLNDPIVYIIVLFVVVSAVVLLLNRLRDRRLIVEPERLVFHSRDREQAIAVKDIEWMHIGKESLVQTAGRFQQVVIKVKGRRRPFRIRIGRYERSGELLAEMQRIAARVPKGRRRQFGLRRRKTV